MKIVVPGQTQVDRYQNMSISKIRGWFYLVQNATATAFSGNPVNMVNAQVEITLRRGKTTIMIYQGNFRDIVAASSWKKNAWQMFVASQVGFSRILLVQALGVAEQITFPVEFDLGGIINLRGEDLLSVKVQMPTSVYDGTGGAACNTTTSYFQYDAAEAIGIEYATPKLEVYTFQASIPSDSVAMGDNVTDALFINYDKTNYLTASRVCNSYNLNSDRLTKTQADNEIYGETFLDPNFIPTSPTFEAYQSFALHSGGEIDKAQAQFTFTAGNMNAGKNVLVYRSFYIDEWLATRASDMKMRHDKKNARKIMRK